MIFLDRVKETFATTGTGTVTFGGAATGWRGFVDALNDDYSLTGDVAAVAYFMIGDPDGDDADNWEFGYGTVDTDAGTITRNLIQSSTGAKISWGAGTKYIFPTAMGFWMSESRGIYAGTMRPAWLRAHSAWLDTDATIPTLYWYDGSDDIAIAQIDTTNNRAYPLDASGARIAGAEVDVGSAATCDIGAAASDNVRITGTTGITSLGTGAAGLRRFVRFEGELTLTYDSGELILPGADDITTAAGDRAIFKSLGAGNWECVDYVRASGAAVVAPENMVGDSGSGGTAGLVPAPEAGDAAAGKFLKADATWASPPTTDSDALCKAWVYFIVSGGTPSIQDDYNVSSITDNGAGNWTVNFMSGPSAANFAWGASLGPDTGSNSNDVRELARSTSGLQYTSCQNQNKSDFANNSVMFFWS
jgi:hypothetical protein